MNGERKSLDERLDALVRSVELLTRDVETMRSIMREEHEEQHRQATMQRAEMAKHQLAIVAAIQAYMDAMSGNGA